MTTTTTATRRFLRSAAACLLSILAASPAAAQEPPAPEEPPNPASVPDDRGVVHSWALTPGDGSLQAGERPNLTYELPPGGSVDDVVTLFNYSNVALDFQIYGTDAYNTEDGSFSLLPADQAPSDVGAWIDLPAKAISVPAGTQATFPIKLTVPPDARPGDHAGAILAGSQAVGTGADGDVITLDRRTGTRMYVRVAGPLHPELAVEDLSTTYDNELDPLGGGATVTYTIANRGNVRLGAEHDVVLSGPFGLFAERSGAETIDEILPGERIEITHELDGVAATGLLFTRVDLQPRSLGDESEDLADADRSALSLAIPLAAIAGLLTVALAAVAWRSFARHRREPELAPIARAEERVLAEQH